jgi:hypothetical protein
MKESLDILSNRNPPIIPAFAKNISNLPYFETVYLSISLTHQIPYSTIFFTAFSSGY